MRMIAVPGLVAQLAHEVEDLGLDRDVERGRRLVGDEQLGLAGEGHGDHHPLGHAARHLVRDTSSRRRSGSGMPTILRSSRARARAALPFMSAVDLEDLVDLAADVQTGLSEDCGCWKIMAIAVAPDLAHLVRPSSCEQVLAVEQDLAGLDPAGRRDEAHDRERRSRSCRSRTRRRGP